MGLQKNVKLADVSEQRKQPLKQEKIIMIGLQCLSDKNLLTYINQKTMSEILHDRENNPISEMFLKSNGKKFNKDCIIVLKILYSGGRYTGKEINDMTNMAAGDRRLRDIYAARKDCKKAPRMKKTGGLEGMEYWLEIPATPTKAASIEWATNLLEKIKNGVYTQGRLM